MATKADIYCAKQAERTALTGLEAIHQIQSALRREFPRANRRYIERILEDLGRQEFFIRTCGNLADAAGFEGAFSRTYAKKLNELEQSLGKLPTSFQAANVESTVSQIEAVLAQLKQVLETIRSDAKAALSGGIPEEAPKLRILLVSDLHCGERKQLQMWPTTQSHFFSGIERELGGWGKVDLVIFAGDLVHSGEPEQFARINDFLSELWLKFNTLRLGNPLMIAIPGNHDLTSPRNAEEKLRASALKRLRSKGNELDVFCELNESDGRKLVSSASSSFESWQAANLRWQMKERDDGKKANFESAPGLLPGEASYRLVNPDLTVGILAFNTAIMHLCEAPVGDSAWPKGAIVLCAQQVMRCAEPGWAQKNDFNILLTHHPFRWFAEAYVDEIMRECLPAYRFDLHLHGHMHDPDFSFEGIAPGRCCYHIQSPALFGEEVYFDKNLDRSEKRVRGFCLIELSRFGGDKAFRAKPLILSRHGDYIPAHDHCKLEADDWTKWCYFGN